MTPTVRKTLVALSFVAGTAAVGAGLAYAADLDDRAAPVDDHPDPA